MKLKYSREKIEDFLKKISRNGKPCPFCGGNRWGTNCGFNNNVHVYQELDENFKPTGNLWPVLLIVCEQCGYSHMFNASVAKVLED